VDPQRGDLPQPRTIYLEPEFERLGQQELRSLQLDLFVKELSRVRHANAFYKRIYDAAGVEVDKIRTLDDVRRVPIIRKKDILQDQEARPPFGDRLQTVVALHIPVTMAAGAFWSLEALRSLGASPLRLGNMPAEDRLAYMNRDCYRDESLSPEERFDRRSCKSAGAR
jgi:hypothetical protein